METGGRAEKLLRVLKDGTLRMRNPLSGVESWFIPGRAARPVRNATAAAPPSPQPDAVENVCDFCEANHLRTPPEKERLAPDGEGYRRLVGLPASALGESVAAFRRVANLFEVIPYHYWVANYGFTLSRRDSARMKAYLSEEAGKAHVRSLVDRKLGMSGCSDREIEQLDERRRTELEEALFGGSHDLIVARRHFASGGERRAVPVGSGDLSPADHDAYIGFTIDAIEDLHAQNEHVKYVMTFQNWLHAGGASFDHLHKQLVGFDGWGGLLERESALAMASPGIHNELLINQASACRLVLADNDHAILIVDPGHRHPTLGVYSKSRARRPWEHSPGEIRGMSALIHAAHRAQGSALPCNEDWFYAPRDCDARIPWRVLIRWRMNNPSGFEGGTDCYIHPVSPFEMRDRLLPGLTDLAKGSSGFQVTADGTCAPDPLEVGKGA